MRGDAWLYRSMINGFESVIKRRKAFDYWKQLDKQQWCTSNSLVSLQVSALKQVCAHAELNCEYYRDDWRTRGLSASQLTSLDAITDWPVISRETILANRLQMRAAGVGKLISKSTGGSSGVPLHFDLDLGSNDRRTGAWYRGYSWAGADPGTKQLYLWGVPLGKRSRWKVYKDTLYHTLYRRTVINCFGLSECDAEVVNRRIRAVAPDVIVAYTNPLYFLARGIQDAGVRAYRPKSIIVGAEKLHKHQRSLIQEVFQAPVFETYGSREFMLIGAECERHCGLHLTAEHLLVEVLDDDGQPTGDGEEGNVVITDLYNYGMPFIRYSIGDRAIAGFDQCECGRGLPLLRKVIGRRLDMLSTPDGRTVPGEFFPHLLKDFQAIRRFQVVQDFPDSIELRVVVDDRWSAIDAQQIVDEVTAVAGEIVNFKISLVDDIPQTAAGKHQVVVNRCTPQVFQSAN